MSIPGYYRPERTVYRLDFSRTAYRGLEVKVRSLTLGEALDAQEVVTELRSAVLAPEDTQRWRDALALLERHVVSWNVVGYEGTPLPATVAGFTAVELPLMYAIVRAWLTAMIGYSPREDAGQSEPEVSDPLEAEAENLGLADASLSL